MKILLWVVVFLLSCQVNAWQCDEDRFTAEQWNILYTAYDTGKYDDLGYATAAIAWQESFVGHYVVRLSPQDGKKGSYGLMHVQLQTAMELLGINDHWKAMADLVPFLIKDDAFAIKVGYSYLHKMYKMTGKDWKKTIMAYNGGYGGIDSDATTAYYEAVKTKVKYLQSCMEV